MFTRQSLPSQYGWFPPPPESRPMNATVLQYHGEHILLPTARPLNAPGPDRLTTSWGIKGYPSATPPNAPLIRGGFRFLTLPMEPPRQPPPRRGR